MRWLRLFFYGACIGAADIIPGVSGGTIAFIMGIYEDLIASIKEFWKKLDFIIPLCLGMVTSMALLAGALQYILGHEVYRIWLYCLFFGLIMASVWFCLKQISKWNLIYTFFLVLGAGAAFALTSFNFEVDANERYEVIVAGEEFKEVSASTLGAMEAKGIVDEATPVHQSGYTYSLSEVVKPIHGLKIDTWLVLCGVIAVTAMLLPGVSGSYMLALLGAYPLVIGAIADLVRGDLEAFWSLASVGIGIFFGAIFFSRIVSWLLRRYHDGTVATLIGFMIGALPVVWPFWSVVYALDPLNIAKGPQLQPVAPALPDWNSPVFLVGMSLALVGFLLVVIMERTAQRKTIKAI